LLRARGSPGWRAAIYAWNPLVLVEVWGSAHLDALAVTLVIGAVVLAVKRRFLLSAGILGLGALVKLYPAALLPLLVRAGGIRMVVPFAIALALGYAPLAGQGWQALGSLPRYLAEEYFNPGLVRSITAVPGASLVAMAVWTGAVAWRARRSDWIGRLVPLIGGLLLLSPNVFPWYALWLVPFLAITPSVPWIAFTGSVAFAYAFFLCEPWAIPMWARLIEIAPLVLGVGWWLARRVRRRGARHEFTGA
jgi:hypothetical protein